MTLFVMLPEVISRLSSLVLVVIVVVVVIHGSCLKVENSTSVTEIYTHLIKEIMIHQGANKIIILKNSPSKQNKPKIKLLTHIFIKTRIESHAIENVWMPH